MNGLHLLFGLGGDSPLARSIGVPLNAPDDDDDGKDEMEFKRMGLNRVSVAFFRSNDIGTTSNLRFLVGFHAKTAAVTSNVQSIWSYFTFNAVSTVENLKFHELSLTYSVLQTSGGSTIGVRTLVRHVWGQAR